MGAFNFTMALLYWLFLSVLCVLFYPFSLKTALWCHQEFGRGFCYWLKIKPKVIIEGPLPEQGILISNHASMFDIFIVASLGMPVRWISKESIGRAPILGFAMRALNAYFLKRNQTGQDLEVLKRVEEDLNQGALVAIYPEGTRTRDGKLRPFKKGAFHLAQRTRVAVHPLALVGTFEIAPKGKLPESIGHHVKLIFGEPYYVDPAQPIEKAAEDARNRIQALLDRATTL